jgi:integrase
VYEGHENKKVTAETVLVFRSIKKLLRRNANARKRVLPPAEFRRLLSHLPMHTLRILATAYYTGMRKAEILELIRPKMHLEERYIDLSPEDTKDAEARRVPIGDELYKILSAIPESPSDPHVFLYRGAPVKDIRAGIQTAALAAGIPYGRKTPGGFTFHDLRHSFNTMMRKAGVADSVIMNITGHKTYEMFTRYDTIDDKDRQAAVRRYERFVQKEKSGDQVVTKRAIATKKGASQ